MKPDLITHQYKLILYCSAFLLGICNIPFFFALTEIYPFSPGNALFIIALLAVIFLIFVSVLSLFASVYTTKILLSIFFITAAFSNYFMYSFGVVIDHVMLQNVAETDVAEVLGVLNYKLILHLLIIGLVPSYLLWKLDISYRDLRSELRCKLTMVGTSVLLGLAIFAVMSSHFIPFLREHKSVRYYVNPIFPLVSGFNFTKKMLLGQKRQKILNAVAPDAQLIHTDRDTTERKPDRELIIMIVGETARADRFQLNGYQKQTNPLLSKVTNLITYSHVTSCGTSTAVSVPCMFSLFKNKDFKKDDIYTHENVLDILKRKGVNILWRDNNSSSKGVADRIDFESFKSPTAKVPCKEECRDENLLMGLESYIDAHPQGDILIILHQMGSHGPEYFKRYPREHEFFTPTCKSAHLADCTSEEISNAYDNTIRYTDYFLSKTIDFIKKYDSQFEAGVFYVSDHGESLGEKGVFLHGLPNLIAPDEQTHVPALLWTGSNFDYPFEAVLPHKDEVFTHENVPCTLLAMFEVFTEECKHKKSMLGPPNQTH